MAGAGSIATVAIGALAMKAFALLVGPEGVGTYALLQSILNLGVLTASIGLQASAITAVGAAYRGSDSAPPEVASHAVMTAVVAGVLGAVVLTALRGPIAELLGASSAGNRDVAFLAVALGLTVAATVGGSVLVGMRELKAATIISIATASAGAALGIVIVSRVGISGLAPTLAVTAGVQALLTFVVMRRIGISPLHRRVLPPAFAARRLVALGAPVALAQLVATGALLLMPIIVLQLLGPLDVGYYRAAAVVSVGIGTFFIAGIHQDYLPRVAAAGDSDRAQLVERRMSMISGIAVPMILVLLAVGPALIDLLYTAQFRPALGVLQWMLVGDLARLIGLVLVTTLLAMRRRATYFMVEAASGLVLVATGVIGASMIGLPGTGLGYACTQVLFGAVAWMALRGPLHLRFGPAQLSLGVAIVGISAVLLVDPSPLARVTIFLPAAAAAALVAWPRLLRSHRADAL